MAQKQLKIKQGSEINTVKAVETPGKWILNKRDLLLGLLIAVGAPVVIQLYEILMAFLDYQPVTLDWRALAKSGIGAGAAYLVKNLFDKSKIVIDKKELE